MAVAHIHYLLGKGIKKHIALERIADALAVSVETLRDWEKALAVTTGLALIGTLPSWPVGLRIRSGKSPLRS